jgi:CRP/FNR family transcriptional regulator, cyclic AMP receptor protein
MSAGTATPGYSPGDPVHVASATAPGSEARGIGTGLRREPLPSRADAVERAKPADTGLSGHYGVWCVQRRQGELTVTADVTGILRETSLLRSVPAEELKAVAAASRLRSFRRGQVVFTRSDPGDTVIVVVSGRVKVTVRSADGGELTLAIIQPGGLLGELGVVDGGPRSADAETLEECQLLLIPRDTIRDICARVPSAAQALTSSIAAMLRRLTEATADLVFLDLPRRVAKILLSQPRGDDGVIRPRMSQEELAHQAGSTRQSVNAALRGFERRGWIDMQDRAVTVKQPDALGRFAAT